MSGPNGFFEPLTARDAWFLGAGGSGSPCETPYARPRLADVMNKVTAGQSPAVPATLELNPLLSRS